jgi:hypothetical protein
MSAVKRSREISPARQRFLVGGQKLWALEARGLPHAKAAEDANDGSVGFKIIGPDSRDRWDARRAFGWRTGEFMPARRIRSADGRYSVMARLETRTAIDAE